MLNFLLLAHILCSLLLIVFVLLNQGKGSELGAINQNNELLSNRDSSLMINRLIVMLALLSILINFLLSYNAKMHNTKQQNEKIVDVPKYIFYYHR